jgi:hypothetical protein
MQFIDFPRDHATPLDILQMWLPGTLRSLLVWRCGGYFRPIWALIPGYRLRDLPLRVPYSHGYSRVLPPSLLDIKARQ